MSRKVRTSSSDTSRLRRDITADEEILERAVAIVKSRMNRGEILDNPADTKRYLVLDMCRLEHEVFSCIFLDNKHRVLGFDRLFTGTIDGAGIYPREVVKKALQYNAAAVILATHRLREALALVDIRVLDHIIVGGCDTVSFAERGVL
jgi:DNA repair protein RadC